MFSLIAVLLYVAFLLSLPLAIFFFARNAGLTVRERTRSGALGFGTSAVLIVLPFAWVGLSVIEFRHSCKPPTQLYVPKWVEPQEGFLLAGDRLSNLSLQKFINVPLSDLTVHGIRYYEERDGWQGSNNVTRFFVSSPEKSKIILSKYSLVTTIEKKSWRPIFHITHTVERISDRAVIASAKDIVFGGGVIGMYLRGLGGGQDAEYLSCGYVSEKIVHWRPSDTSDPSYREYQRTDFEFLLKALGH